MLVLLLDTGLVVAITIGKAIGKPISSNVRRGSHWGGSPQNGLGDERTCGMTLASAYVLRRLSAAWSQLQMKERESEWE